MIAAAFLVASCGCPRHCPYRNIRQVDSFYVHTTDTVIVRDTIIQAPVPADSSQTAAPDLQPGDTLRAETNLAAAEAWVDESGLNLKIRNKPEKTIPVTVPIVEKSHTSDQGLVRTVTVPVEVERQLTKWQSFRMTVGDIALVALYIALVALVFWLVLKKKP